MKIVLPLVLALALVACDRTPPSAATPVEQMRDGSKKVGDLTYREVCIDGVVHYASLVTTYAGSAGFSHTNWVIGPAKSGIDISCKQ